ncbi:hypothetical protein GCM10017600_81600 [Streptosporangium carneum]|uniref:Uncharacterized protein n=1 Tax=Streptosporangium carneum TaxID=47481 RepID=A0A9W6IAS2_9ACTN|nr:hypothetical protein GCM10017600_81600 [Streptosporangium carneum]
MRAELHHDGPVVLAAAVEGWCGPRQDGLNRLPTPLAESFAADFTPWPRPTPGTWGVPVAIAEDPTDMGLTCMDGLWARCPVIVFFTESRRSAATPSESASLLPGPRVAMTR